MQTSAHVCVQRYILGPCLNAVKDEGEPFAVAFCSQQQSDEVCFNGTGSASRVALQILLLKQKPDVGQPELSFGCLFFFFFFCLPERERVSCGKPASNHPKMPQKLGTG